MSEQRLIDANALYKQVNEIVFHMQDRAYLRETILNLIDNAPTVEERLKGE